MLRAAVPLALLGAILAGCKNPFYWVVPARKLFVSVPSARGVFELDRGGLRSTWGKVAPESGPTRLAHAGTRGALYALLPEAGALAELSPDSYQVIATISTGGRSTDLALSGDEQWAYALNPEERTVVRISLRTRRVDRTIPFLDGAFQPAAIGAFPSRPDDLYVVSTGGQVSVVREGSRGALSLALAGVGKPARVVAAGLNALLVVDASGPNLHRITEPDAPRAETIRVGFAGGSAAAGPDGAVYMTAPAADRVLKIASDGSFVPFEVGGKTPRAIAADEHGVYIANEGSNQVVGMVVENGRLQAAVEMDRLPGPPADLAAAGGSFVTKP